MVPVQYTEGQEAYWARLDLDANPYPRGGPDSDWAWWRKGWLASKEDDGEQP